MQVFAEELTPEELERHQLRCMIKSQLRRASKEENEGKAACTYCKCELTKAQTCLTLIVPAVHGGQLETANVAIACSSCANSKHSRSLPEWIERLNDQLDGVHALMTAQARKAEAAA